MGISFGAPRESIGFVAIDWTYTIRRLSYQMFKSDNLTRPLRVSSLKDEVRNK